MQRGIISIDNLERYSGNKDISKEKINKAIKAATDKLTSKLEEYSHSFVGAVSKNGKYPLGENNSWVSGMHTGTIILAYELTGDKKFLDAALAHVESYQKRLDEKDTSLDDHDVGFIFTPSIVALYKITGDEKLRDMALAAAEHLYDNDYSQKGGFLVRTPNEIHLDTGCRTMMDSLMNIPLFFWAYEQCGDKKFLDAANSQLKITSEYLIREDGSSYHHYQFDTQTHEPRFGCTFQGRADESTWSRGQSWGVYGLPMAYTYNGDESLWPLHRDVCAFTLNHLPEDNIPYYDYDFVEKCDEPRDVSAGLVSACGLLEACKYLDDDAKEKEIYHNAAMMMIEAAIDICADYENNEFDGLVNYVTVSAPHKYGCDECALYGDYFYMEALLRVSDPEWERMW